MENWPETESLTVGCSNTSSLSHTVMFRKQATCLQDKKDHWHLFRWQIYLQCTVILQKGSARESANRALNHSHTSTKKKKKKRLSEIFCHHIISCQMILFVLLREIFSDTGCFHMQIWLPLELQWEHPSSGKDEFICSLLGQLLELRHKRVHFLQMTIKGSWGKAQMKTSMLQGEVKPDR